MTRLGAKQIRFLVTGLVLVAVVVVLVIFRPGDQRLRASMASGEQSGAYFGHVEKLVAAAKNKGATLTNVITHGSADNVQRLVAAQESCEVQLALAQEGTPLPPGITALGRLPWSETVFLLGRHAEDLKDLKQLAGLRIAIGLEGSGTAQLAHQVFDSPALAPLNVTMINQPLKDAIEAARRGDVDLAFAVIDEDAPLITSALSGGELKMVSLNHPEVLAHRMPFLGYGKIVAGQFDPIAMEPKEDKRVWRVATLVLTNGCLSRSKILSVMELITDAHPDFLARNKDSKGALAVHPAAKSYLDHGAEWSDEYFPWLVDILPVEHWIYAATVLSLLLNVRSSFHRSRLRRIYAARLKVERELATLFHRGITTRDLDALTPTEAQRQPEFQARLKQLVEELQVWFDRSQDHALSAVTPPGEEMEYQGQEELLYQQMSALREFLAKCA